MKENNDILLTGATGFVGSALLNKLDGARVLGRSSPTNFNGTFYKSDLKKDSNFTDCLQGIKTIVHCAARVHVMNEELYDPIGAYREVNVDATLALAGQASALGVKRFIFISSIKVNGEKTESGQHFYAGDRYNPRDAYARSKAEAESKLKLLANETGLEVVIIRPPLVYGPDVKGNLKSLLGLAHTRLPLPFGLVNNLRSMVYLDNLVDLIITCTSHPDAANQIFIASDGRDISTSQLLRLIRRSMNRPVCLLPVPLSLFRVAGKLVGKSEVINRLVDNLQVDHKFTKEQLGWSPPYSIEEGVDEMVSHYFRNR